jgi:hypothetical protein
MADGSDIAMFDVEVLDANGNRCPTFEDRVDFTCSGQGIFLGGYNSGIRYSTNVNNLTSGYHLNVECGINRVFVRSTRTAGTFTLNVTGTGLSSATASVASVPVSNPNGLSTVWPQKFSVALGAEPPPVKEGVPPPPPAPGASPAPATDVVDLVYSGANPNATLITGIQTGALVYMDRSVTFGTLPAYLTGGEFIRPYQNDAGESSSTDQYQFNLSRYSYVYQLIDAANDMPAHENNLNYQWKKLPDQVVVNGRPMNVFKSRLMAPYENCFFAVNGYGIARFDPASNMYLVFVLSAETHLQVPGQTIIASTTQGGHPVSTAIDGDTVTRWAAADGTYPQTLTLDLGQPSLIGGYLINWYNNATRAYKYKVEVSNDDVIYNLSLDQQGNTTMGYNEYRIPATGAGSGRYIRITVTGGPGFASIYELIVNGVLAAPVSVTAAPSSGQVALNWNAVNGATSYAVKRATISGGPYTTVGTPGSTDYTDGSLTNGNTYYYVVTSVNNGGEGSNSVEVTAQPLSPIQLWRQTNFGTINANDPVAGDAAMPMNDGITNLMKYALGLDPKKMDAAGLPSPALLSGYLTLTFNRQKIATDITYHVEASFDFNAWPEIWNSSGVAYGGGSASAQPVTVSDTVPISTVHAGGRFLRLKITRP